MDLKNQRIHIIKKKIAYILYLFRQFVSSCLELLYYHAKSMFLMSIWLISFIFFIFCKILKFLPNQTFGRKYTGTCHILSIFNKIYNIISEADF